MDMSNYTCEYFETERGDRPVEMFIDSLKESTQRKFFFKKTLLEELGPLLPIPHAKKLREGIYELRFEGQNETARLLYFFVGKRVIFTNGFKKKSQKTPAGEMDLAARRRSLFLRKKEDKNR